MREALLSEGTFVDIALAALLVELVVIVMLARRGHTRLRALDVLGQVIAGALLLAGLRVALSGGDTEWVAVLMTASLPAHLFDLARRATVTVRANGQALGERRR